jgi:hypothetical protein
VEPTDALRAIEVALRLAVRQVLGGTEWLKAKGAPEREKLAERQEVEVKRRDGTVVSEDLLDYTETYHLTELVKKNWDSFSPVFVDKKRTEAFFGVIEDVRNSIAHSRDLVPFERDLITGIAGLLRNQVALYRSGAIDAAAQHYPLIESLKDSFGRDGHPLGGAPGRFSRIRLEVGDVITFVGKATDPRGGRFRGTSVLIFGRQCLPRRRKGLMLHSPTLLPSRMWVNIFRSLCASDHRRSISVTGLSVFRMTMVGDFSSL